jgi:hypothetical protein
MFYPTRMQLSGGDVYQILFKYWESHENGRSEGHDFLEASINIRTFYIYCQIWLNIGIRNLRIVPLSKSGQ